MVSLRVPFVTKPARSDTIVRIKEGVNDAMCTRTKHIGVLLHSYRDIEHDLRVISAYLCEVWL